MNFLQTLADSLGWRERLDRLSGQRGPGLTRERIHELNERSRWRDTVRARSYNPDAGGVRAAEAKRQRRRERNLALVERGGFKR